MAPIPDRTRYRLRLKAMFASPPQFRDEDPVTSIERQSQWAKYTCVLVSGFVEQALREILLSYSALKSSPAVSRYVERSWPSSKNMNTGNIVSILQSFKQSWADDFEAWLLETEERKATINNLVSWRNNIAHGNEASTTGVTLTTVEAAFNCACKLVDHIEGLVSGDT
jgi:hypothetical protein